MIRLLTLAVIAAVVCRWLTGKWPWQLWFISERSQQEAQARALLGLNRFATETEILEAHRRLIGRVHPDRGGTAEQVHAADAARDLLLVRWDRSKQD